MKLDGVNLEKWLENAARGSPPPFPWGRDYFTQYAALRNRLNEYVHAHVTSGAIATDGGYLTDHGPDHVRMVIRRASELVSAAACELTPYEVYMLLAAIHFHDVGNAFGRTEHERRCADVMTYAGTVAGDDSPEKRCIVRVAQAHGGTIARDRDTIGALQRKETILGHDVQTQLLAGILRFADELADDRSRAARFLCASGALPPESQIYHEYAQALHSVKVDTPGREIRLKFDLPSKLAGQTFPKGNGGCVYLLDEIMQRTLKMHQERIYCMRFMYSYIPIDAISVTIEITPDNYSEPMDTLGYRLEERGYPLPMDIYVLCPELQSNRGWGGIRVDGQNLSARLQGNS